MPSDLVHLYMRVDHLPQIWCPGCGNGVIMHDVAVALDELIHDPETNLNRDDIVIVSGIGCSSRAAGYMDFNSIHTTHGRAIAFATGIKFANPRLHVIVLTGDGDCSAIGGNHLIHAARRNLGLTVIAFNNDIYGMTGGQYSPTTPNGDKATTAPYGNVDRPFDIAHLAAGAGASFAARGDVYHARETIDIIKQAIMHKGFSLVDVYSICPTYYGRKNKKGDAVEMMKWQKDNLIPTARYYNMSEEDKAGKKMVGILSFNDYPEYTEEYAKVIKHATEARKKK
ncbi:MAG: 2-oxoacid:ferredoxin oxidoreductase subunit beta [Clostridia bacterium]|nr:2-oxoacid:ferredoxin oxidoreductase subunit beta [Eubacterium sp.]MBR2559981.1 2-oxoacid:ferredoxin oxidoreductase subunit beta [Bacillota bacterium]MCR4669433.1 2-oxoacid:ferredoxin oxidoreductase subunit beta [Clostridia bacterium]